MAQVVRVAVVEDESPARERVLDHLRRYGSDQHVTFDVQTYSDGRDLLSGYRPDHDVIFLDIQMRHLDGLETARRVRTVDADVVIVFITNMAQYAIRGYEVDALSYLVKPVPYFAFAKEMTRCLARLRRAGSESIVVATGSELARVDVVDIVYIESERHRITVHALDRSYVLTGTLKSFEAELGGKGFFRSNNCYLVNLRHVTAVDQAGCTMVGGAHLQVSRPRRRDFLDALTDHLGGRPT